MMNLKRGGKSWYKESKEFWDTFEDSHKESLLQRIDSGLIGLVCNPVTAVIIFVVAIFTATK